MIGLAMSPGTLVEPTCSTLSARSPRAALIRFASQAKFSGHRGSYSTRVIELSKGLSSPTVTFRSCSSVIGGDGFLRSANLVFFQSLLKTLDDQRTYSFLPGATGTVDSCMIVRPNQLSVLDNPVWSALSTTHASFAVGNESAKRYPVDVAPFGATRDQSAESYDSLARLLGPGETAALPLATMPDLPTGWTTVFKVDSAQMVWTGPAPPRVNHNIQDLNISHVQEMLALVELTKPGPFFRRTPMLGTYLGIYEAGQLVAMAGERLRPFGYTEVSAVCTHPEYRGRGYASSLVSALIEKITGRGEIPFLHVRTVNAGAIRVYEKLGFKTRRVIKITIVKKEP